MRCVSAHDAAAWRRMFPAMVRCACGHHPTRMRYPMGTGDNGSMSCACSRSRHANAGSRLVDHLPSAHSYMGWSDSEGLLHRALGWMCSVSDNGVAATARLSSCKPRKREGRAVPAAAPAHLPFVSCGHSNLQLLQRGAVLACSHSMPISATQLPPPQSQADPSASCTRPTPPSS